MEKVFQYSVIVAIFVALALGFQNCGGAFGPPEEPSLRLSSRNPDNIVSEPIKYPSSRDQFGPCYNGRTGDVIGYQEFAASEFTSMTPESSQKMDFTQPVDPGAGSNNLIYVLSDVDKVMAQVLETRPFSTKFQRPLRGKFYFAN